MSNKKKDDGEVEELNEGVKNAYAERLKTLKQALDFVAKNDLPKSVEKFKHYLGILAAYNRTDEKHLTPKMFDPERDVAELLLVSQAYWNLAKSYDKSPRFRQESVRCLQQFIQFSIGYKYQHANAQLIKKFLRSGQAHNKKAFQQAYEKINVRFFLKKIQFSILISRKTRSTKNSNNTWISLFYQRCKLVSQF